MEKSHALICGAFDPIHENLVRVLSHASKNCLGIHVVVLGATKLEQRRRLLELRLDNMKNGKVHHWIPNGNNPVDSSHIPDLISKLGKLQDAPIVQMMGQDAYMDHPPTGKHKLWLFQRLGLGDLQIQEADKPRTTVALYKDAMEICSSKIRRELGHGVAPGNDLLHPLLQQEISDNHLYDAKSGFPLIVITGGAGSGRTSVGKQLAQALDFDLVSGDDVFKEWLASEESHIKVLRTEMDKRWDVGMRNFSDWFITRCLKRNAERGMVLEGEGIYPSKLRLIEDKLGEITLVAHLRCPPNECTRRLKERGTDLGEAHLRWKQNIGCRTQNLKREQRFLEQWIMNGGDAVNIRTHALSVEGSVKMAEEELQKVLAQPAKPHTNWQRPPGTRRVLLSVGSKLWNPAVNPPNVPIASVQPMGISPQSVTSYGASLNMPPGGSPGGSVGMSPGGFSPLSPNILPRQPNQIIANYNNLAKTVLLNQEISKYFEFGPSISVLDFCCGRGTDIGKLGHVLRQNNKKMVYTGIDLTEQSVRAAQTRVAAPNDSLQDAYFFVGDCCQKDGVIQQFDSTTKERRGSNLFFHLVSCQFSVHYAMKDQQTAESFFQNATQRLVRDGHLIITTVSAEELGKCAKWCTANKTPNYDAQLHTVRFPSMQAAHEIKNSWNKDVFGLTYSFALKDSAICSEFLITEEGLKALGKKYGLELEGTFPLQALSAQQNLRADLRRFGRKYDAVGGTMLDQDEKSVVQLYKAYVFRKTSGKKTAKELSENLSFEWSEAQRQLKDPSFIGTSVNFSPNAKEFEPNAHREEMRSDAPEFTPGLAWNAYSSSPATKKQIKRAGSASPERQRNLNTSASNTPIKAK